MTVGIISDTHGYFDPTIDQYVLDCDEIWHLGDIGSLEVLEKVNALPSKSRVVYGNIDSKEIQHLTDEFLTFEIEGVKFLLIHIAGRIEKYNKQVSELIQSFNPDVLVCGHSHILKVAQDKRYNLLYVNPGAAGNHGFHKMRTIIKMEVLDGKLKNMAAVELGTRGKITT